jgi:hypothetical protein
VREREEKKEKERERERWLGAKRAGFFAYREVIQITSRLRQSNLVNFLLQMCLPGNTNYVSPSKKKLKILLECNFKVF